MESVTSLVVNANPICSNELIADDSWAVSILVAGLIAVRVNVCVDRSVPVLSPYLVPLDNLT